MTNAIKKKHEALRQNLRIDPSILGALDLARSKRGGFISRNTWILEAIIEKLTREQENRGADGGEQNVHFL